LEAALELHAGRRRLFVRLLVPHEPLADLLLHWQGNFSVAPSPSPLLPKGPFGLVLTSSPERILEGLLAPVDLLPGDPRVSAEVLWLCRCDLPSPRFGTQVQPNSQLLHNLLTIRSLQLDSPREALSLAKRLLLALPTYPPIHDLVSHLAEQTGDFATARRAEAQARALRQANSPR
jgi:hypothetical protein